MPIPSDKLKLVSLNIGFLEMPHNFFIDTIDIQYKHNFLCCCKQQNLTLYTIFLCISTIFINHYYCHNRCIIIQQTLYNSFHCIGKKITTLVFLNLLSEYSVNMKRRFNHVTNFKFMNNIFCTINITHSFG